VRNITHRLNRLALYKVVISPEIIIFHYFIHLYSPNIHTFLHQNYLILSEKGHWLYHHYQLCFKDNFPDEYQLSSSLLLPSSTCSRRNTSALLLSAWCVSWHQNKCQTTEGNKMQWPQPGKITHWLHHFFITTRLLREGTLVPLYHLSKASTVNKLLTGKQF